MNFNFGEVLSRAWQIVWKHKSLWIFGILASCGRGGSSFNGNTSSQGDVGVGPPNFPPEVMRLLQTIQENLTVIIIIGCIVFLLIWAITMFLGAIGKVGLIRGTFQADEGAEKLVFGQLFSESTSYFWRVFGLSLLVALPVFVMFVALVAGALVWAISVGDGPAGSGTGFAAAGIILLCTICFLVPISFVIGMIARQAENAIVLEDMRVLPSLSRGWDVFRRNLGPIILMAIILAVIGLAVGFVIAIPLLIIVTPAIVALMTGEALSGTPLVLMGIGLCLYIPVSLLLNGIMIAYTESAWTLTYMRLTAKPLDNAPVVLEANA